MEPNKRYGKHLFRFIFLTTILLFSAPQLFAAALELDDQTVAVGDAVSFILSVNDAPNRVFSLGFEIGFDPKVLQFKHMYVTGGLLEAWSFVDIANPTAGVLRLGAFDLKGFSAGTNGHLAVLAFSVIGSQECTITLTELVDDVSGWSVKPGHLIFAPSEPRVDIRVNSSDGPLSIQRGMPVSVAFTLGPGTRLGQKADWWVVAITPFGTFSYVYPETWVSGIQPCIQFELIEISEPFQVLNIELPAGNYRFGVAVDNNADGILDATWWDIADVCVY